VTSSKRFRRFAQGFEIAPDRARHGNPHTGGGGFLIPKSKVKIAAAVERIKKTDRNVLGYLPAAGRVGAATEYVMLGATMTISATGIHRLTETRRSRGEFTTARMQRVGRRHVASIGRIFGRGTKERPLTLRRGVVFAFWSGEELGPARLIVFRRNIHCSVLSNVLLLISTWWAGCVTTN